tara:strand:+ start:10044 stop:11153 length:1110 start_codon:yes stop_codon:yes gene_type:complete
MKFLNGKEEVMNIKLTSYGKYLLSKGEFRPHFYSFFDDGILYDSQYGGFNESQKDIQSRIKNQTPRLATQYNYAGAETHILKQNEEIIASAPQNQQLRQDLIPSLNRIQVGEDKYNSFKYAIGTSTAITQYSPAWNIKFLSNSLINASASLSNALGSSSIPQLQTGPIKYKMVAGLASANQDLAEVPYVFGEVDGSVTYIDVLVDSGDIILDISEENVFFGERNFEVEVYEVENQSAIGGGTIEVLTPLYFSKPTTLIKNNVLLDEEEAAISDEYPSRGYLFETEGDLGEIRKLHLDPSYAEYFISIDVDEEIDRETLCKLTADESRGMFGQQSLNCDDVDKGLSSLNTGDVFGSDVDSDSLGGECDDT